jgi:GAF domain-containing protein
MDTKEERNHFNLLYDISELATILTGSDNIDHFLHRTVEVVSRHLDADVCSIYLFDEGTKELVSDGGVEPFCGGEHPHEAGRRAGGDRHGTPSADSREIGESESPV